MFEVLAGVCGTAGFGWPTMSEDSYMMVEPCSDSPLSHMRVEPQSVFIKI